MQKILCLYATTDGQTIKIFNHMKQSYSEKPIHFDFIDLTSLDTTKKQAEIALSKYDKVIIGASIRYGSLSNRLYDFIKIKESQLKAHSGCAFFLVNLTARKEGKDNPENNAYMKRFLKKSPWHPQKVAIFAGALHYPSYRFFDRIMIQFIMRITGGETDTSKDIEYTNWDKVTKFAMSVINNDAIE